MILYELSNVSKLDLEEIWFWTLENFSINQADFYIESIIHKIELHCFDLEKDIIIEQSFLDFKYFTFKSHYIFYLRSSENKISIVRILHGNRNFNRILKQPF